MRHELSTPVLLRTMRVTLHVSFAGLLVLALVRALVRWPSGHTAQLVTLLSGALSLATFYLAGTIAENRVARGRADRASMRLAPAWLLIVTLLWALLALQSADFSWVVFPLFFLYPVLLSPPVALACVTLLVGVVGVTQYLHAPSGSFTAPMVIGPAIGAVVALLVSYGYRALYRDAQRHVQVIRQLESTREELARQERTAGTMSERERLSREIHDTLAQGLTSIVLVSRAAQQSLADDQRDITAARLATIEGTAAANLAEARRFVRDLASPALDESLPAALSEVCRRTEEGAQATGTGLTCEFSVQGEIPELTGPQRTLFIRAAQSTLANVTSHAHASRVVVTLAGWEDAVTLDVVDDGVGFDPRAAARRARGDSYGLSHLRRRAEELGAELTVESEPRGGTVVNVRLPLADTVSGPRVADTPAAVGSGQSALSGQPVPPPAVPEPPAVPGHDGDDAARPGHAASSSPTSPHRNPGDRSPS
ncbi:sensor histidine kinase [Kocuria sp. HSID17590]|uniref:sensor histidine kinase n=3 Tax=Kocuria TaxID=57493 RepID=UPI000F8612E3|nr:sensor histidine kinase [Kocuria sp. HSID17590]RUP81554.1 sensor histidine kinase [Kocuria sp. HSID17590]